MFGTKMIQAGLAATSGPTPDDLAEAPLLDHYGFALNVRDQLVLQGRAIGHAVLGDTDVTTSALILIDPERRIARTASRWYRLGQREQDISPSHRGPDLSVVKAYLDAQLQLLLSFADPRGRS